MMSVGMAARVLVERLSYQFTFPVRWIATQDPFFEQSKFERFYSRPIRAASSDMNTVGATQVIALPTAHVGRFETLARYGYLTMTTLTRRVGTKEYE
jgi:hypothetical protein